MKAAIVHEIRGRMRLKLFTERLSMDEADLMESYLKSLPGVESAAVHERTSSVIVCYDGERQDILSAVSGFSLDMPGLLDYKPPHTSRALNDYYQEQLTLRIASHYGARLFLPMPLRVLRTVYHAVPFLLKGLRSLRAGELRAEVLDAISISVSMMTSDFDTAGSVTFLLGVGELLEEWTHKKSVNDLAESMALNVDKAWLVTESGDILTPVRQISSGSLIKVNTGGIIPLDGVITEGDVMINQSSLTGESVPVAKSAGMTVYAGTVIEEGEVTIQVTAQQGQSKYDQIISMIESSEEFKSAAETKASRLADRLVPYTLAGSALTYALTRNATRAISLLMVDFSCALKLTMPLSVLSAMREAGKSGITVKGGKFLESFAEADTIVFDKTGTLTYACPEVAKVITFGGNDEQKMLRIAACLEEHFPHSIANSVVRAARERHLEHHEMHSQVEYIVAHGISTHIGDDKAIIGSAHFVFEDEGAKVPEGDEQKFNDLPSEYSHLYLAIGGELAAVICISDPLREEAVEALQRLRALGFTNTVMLTGDSYRTAEAVAREVGVDQFRAEVLPGDKANFVQEERAKGHKVVMVGDGINDSPALSAADVGIAISNGAAIAREVADITVSADSLHELVALRGISMSLMQRIDANYRFIMGFNSSLMALGALGLLTPSTSALLHNTSTIAVGLKSMTALKPRQTLLTEKGSADHEDN